jgi:hypothetical protein
MNNTTVDVSNDDVQFHFHHHHHLSNLTYVLDSTHKINHKMSASNDELLLYKAARFGNFAKVKELLFKGVGTDFRDGVS